MKTLTLFRHAKSGWDSPVARDFDRPLNDRGRRGAKLMGTYAKRETLSFDHILSSPAVRCLETLDGFWDGYGEILHPNWERRIYLASGVTLLDVVREIPDDWSNVMMCGHNPGLEDLAMMLVPDTKGDALRDALEEKYPTACIAEIAIDVTHWADIKDSCGRLTRFVRPRDLDPTLGPEVD
jgi:phosphohistidine phosphatase